MHQCMRGGVMTIRAKIVAGLVALFVIIAMIDAYVYVKVADQVPRLDAVQANADITSSHADELLSSVLDMKLDVVQVQQYLTDISATRGQDGLENVVLPSSFTIRSTSRRRFSPTSAALRSFPTAPSQFPTKFARPDGGKRL